MLQQKPAVFAVENTYQLLIPTKQECLVWVRVDGVDYFDESNGILRSLSTLHRVTVPMAALDEAKEYTVCLRPLVERKPYFSLTAPVEEYPFSYRPVPKTAIRLYHIADAHNRLDGPIAAARAFGAIDLLVLNGDVIDHSGDPTQFDNIYAICAALTGGEIPVVFSRGNHDLRGKYAERFADYTPNSRGNTYYTFRLGGLWGMLLDCGEDKPDDHEEYGHTVCCHPFRVRQTAYIQDVIARAADEYAAPGITTRLVISHVPFSYTMEPPFDIEQELFGEWCTLLREEIKPDLMLCGHLHVTEVWQPGCQRDHKGQPCPVVIGAIPAENGGFVGCGLTLNEDSVVVCFTDSNGEKQPENVIAK